MINVICKGTISRRSRSSGKHTETTAACAQVDTEIFDVLIKETGRSREELHSWAGSENELKRVRCAAPSGSPGNQ